MRKMLKISIAAAMIMSISSAQAEEGFTVLRNVKVNGEIRARFEYVEQDNTTANANAITNRFKIGINADLLGTDWISGYGEMTNVATPNNNYNDLNDYNGIEANSVVVDPAQTRLTQGYIDAKMGNTLLRAGRQMVNLDNQRFIGAVEWRQMPQTFDAVVVANDDIQNLSLVAAKITGVNRVNFNETNVETNSVILHAAYKVSPALNVTAYDYMISAGTGVVSGVGLGSDTKGLALSGDVSLSESMKLNYRTEYAKQSNATTQNSDYVDLGALDNVNAYYMNIELGIKISGLLVGVAKETLGGSNGSDTKTEFSTPLATLHGKNGWADMFMTTPTWGLVDTSVTLGYKAKGFGTLNLIHHTFAAEATSADYGKELDAVYSNKVAEGVVGMVKIASYTAETFGVDTQKIWLMLDYKFAKK